MIHFYLSKKIISVLRRKEEKKCSVKKTSLDIVLANKIDLLEYSPPRVVSLLTELATRKKDLSATEFRALCERFNKDCLKLGNRLPGSSGLGNTRLTEILAMYAFDESSLHEVAHALVPFLIDSGSESLMAILKLANTPTHSPQLPRNTPLLLSLKADDYSLFSVILDNCNAEDMLEKTYLGNNILHLTVAAGKPKYIQLIMQKAKQLGILDQMILAENNKGISSEKIFQHLYKSKSVNVFRPTLDILDPLLGGDEINKARLNSGVQSYLLMRIPSFAEFEKLSPGCMSKSASLLELSTLIA
jgi:hypothetical protein